MSLSTILTKLTKTVKSNSPEILTALGVSGVITTAYLAAKASFKSAVKLGYTDPKQGFKEDVKLVWKEYIPASIAGGLTVCCIIGASKSNAKRTAAAVTAYSLTEKAFSEYKEKVVEEIGKGKEQKIRDEAAQQKVTNNPPTGKETLLVGPGYILCCELFTGRYFRCDMEKLQRAKNKINAKINNELYVALDEFYELIGLPSTSNSGFIGWNSDRQMELLITTVLSDSGEPCLAFEYNYTKPLFN